MPLASVLHRIDRKYAWSFFGVVLATAFGLIGLVVGLYPILHEKKARLSVEITSEANVLDVRQPLKDLAILFRHQDIQEANLNLKVITVRVENAGEVDILQSHYDRDDVWGIHVHSGKLIEVRLVTSNSDYVGKNLSPQLIPSDLIVLRKIIFERGKFFVLELLVLHSKEKSPGRGWCCASIGQSHSGSDRASMVVL